MCDGAQYLGIQLSSYTFNSSYCASPYLIQLRPLPLSRYINMNSDINMNMTAHDCYVMYYMYYIFMYWTEGQVGTSSFKAVGPRLVSHRCKT